MDLRNYVLGGYDVEEKRQKLCDMIAKITNEKLMDYLIRFIELAIKEWNWEKAEKKISAFIFILFYTIQKSLKLLKL